MPPYRGWLPELGKQPREVLPTVQGKRHEGLTIIVHGIAKSRTFGYMESMSTKLVLPKTVDVVEFDRPPGLPATCTDANLLDAVKASIAGATDEDLAPLLHVPPQAVKWWVASAEWNAIKTHVLPAMKGLFHTQLCGIRSSVIQKLAERVRLGDPIYTNLGEPALNEQGEQLYRPIKAKELAGILVQTSEVLHNLEVEIGVVADDRGIIDLDDLAIALANIAKAGHGTDITAESKRLS